MLLHLALGFDHKTQADLIAGHTGKLPMAKAPPYQSGLKRLVWLPSSSMRCWVHAR